MGIGKEKLEKKMWMDKTWPFIEMLTLSSEEEQQCRATVTFIVPGASCCTPPAAAAAAAQSATVYINIHSAAIVSARWKRRNGWLFCLLVSIRLFSGKEKAIRVVGGGEKKKSKN